MTSSYLAIFPKVCLFCLGNWYLATDLDCWHGIEPTAAVAQAPLCMKSDRDTQGQVT